MYFVSFLNSSLFLELLLLSLVEHFIGMYISIEIKTMSRKREQQKYPGGCDSLNIYGIAKVSIFKLN